MKTTAKLREKARALKRKWKRTPRPYMAAILAGERMLGIDVGAAVGLQPQWLPFLGTVEFLAFEPHEPSRRELQGIFSRMGFGSMFRVLPHALSGSGGERQLHITNVPTGTSILPLKTSSRFFSYVRPGYYFPMRTEKIETRKLADVLDEIREHKIDLIKLDTQGSEEEILRGLDGPRLSGLLLAEAEIPFHDVHENQTSFHSLEKFLCDHGMEMMNFTVARSYRPRNGVKDGYQREVFGVHWHSPKISARIWEIDAVFFRRPELILLDGGPAVRKLIVCYCAYNYFSEAFWLSEEAQKQGVFTPQEAGEIQAQIKLWHRKIHYRFWHAPTSFWNWWRGKLQHYRLNLNWGQYIWLQPPDS